MARKKSLEEQMLEAELSSSSAPASPKDATKHRELEAELESASKESQRERAQKREARAAQRAASAPKRRKIALAAAIGLVVVAVVAIVAVRVSHSNSTDSWDGTADTSWYSENLTSMTIDTAEQLAGMRELCNSGTDLAGISFKLGRNLDLRDTPTKPIGDGTQDGGTYMEFRGSFDGGGHTISGINVEEDMWDYAGLFGVIDGGDVKNLTVEGKVTGMVRVGGIAGEVSGGSIVNCTNRCKVSSTKTATSYYPVTADVGGVCGIWLAIGADGTDSAEIRDLVNEGDVSARACSAGGVIGTIANTNDFTVKVSNLENDGTVTAYCESDERDEAVGGVVGVVGQLGTDTFSNLVNNGEVSCSSVLSVGGVFGALMPGAVSEIMAYEEDAGAVAGGSAGASASSASAASEPAQGTPTGKFTSGVTVSRCSNTARIAANSQDERAHIGGIVGYLDDPDVEFKECENTGELAATNGRTDELCGTGDAEVWDAWEEAHPPTYY